MIKETMERRNFLKGAAAMMALFLTEKEMLASPPPEERPVPGPPVKIGVVGLGAWGKEILSTLSRLPSAQVTAICDHYEPYLKKSTEIAPKATTFADYRKLLESPTVEAVVVATPSHHHKELALAAIQAGKHTYCEAPLAGTIDDAKAIARAAQAASKQVFQAGLQGRSNSLYQHVAQFVKAGVLGDSVLVSAQWNKKESWRRAAPTPEREKEMNWRLSKGTSSGLLGEIGIHQLDLTNRYLNALPSGVTGFGSINLWRDGREVPDSVQCILEYPNKGRTVFTATLANSFGGAYTLFEGSNSSLMMMEKRSWLIKEADSPLLGWEVYARKEPVLTETGIAMVSDATKLLEAGKEPGKEGAVEPKQEALYLAFENFTRSIREDKKSVCGPVEGYQAAVVALKANEAVLSGAKIAYQSEWFDLNK